MPDSNRIGRIYVGIDVTWNENIPLNESSYFEPLKSILNVITPVKSSQITDFEYLVGLSHIDHDILYEVTRIGKSKGFIVAWRKPVFSAGQYGREEEVLYTYATLKPSWPLTTITWPTSTSNPRLPTHHHLIQIRVYERVNASSNRNSTTPPASY